MIKINLILSIVFFIFAAIVVGAQTMPQTVFNSEEKVKKKAALPEAVVAVLKSDKIVDGCFQTKGKGAKNEAEWFAASEIDLNGDGRQDLIIKAEDACLFGANQAPFWIFQNAPDGYQKILSANGLQLEVLTKKSNSFRQIKISKVVGMKPSSEIYGFRAGKYQSLKPRK